MTTNYDELVRYNRNLRSQLEAASGTLHGQQRQLDAQAGEIGELTRYRRAEARRAALRSLVDDEHIPLDVEEELFETSLFDDDQFTTRVDKIKARYARTPETTRRESEAARRESEAAVAWACAHNEKAGYTEIRGDILSRYRRAVAAREAPSPDRYDAKLGTFREVW